MSMQSKANLDNGWLKHGYELNAAIRYAGFGTLESIVIEEVELQIFGPARLKFAKIKPSALAREIGQDQPNVSKVIARLVSNRVLIRGKGTGLVSINRAWSEWQRDGKPRFTPLESVRIASASKRAMMACNGADHEKHISEDMGADPEKHISEDMFPPSDKCTEHISKDMENISSEICHTLRIENLRIAQRSFASDPEKHISKDMGASDCSNEQMAPAKPTPSDFASAIALMRDAANRNPTLEASLDALEAFRRQDVIGVVDAIGSDGWRWQFAVGRFLSESGAKVRAGRNTKRHVGWIRTVAQDADESERNIETSKASDDKPVKRRNVEAERKRREEAEKFARLHAKATQNGVEARNGTRFDP